MTDPFFIEGPAVISFSGGRTSGYMLRRILDAHDGALPPDVHTLFSNTGKEREETLAFVRDCGERWGVPIHWLQRTAGGGVEAVTFDTAARKGEPFDALLTERKFLPNPVMRFCTTELKIRAMKGWMLARGYEHWTNVVGLRFDEARRVGNVRSHKSRERWEVACPLYDARVTVVDVTEFWKAQPFDLRLQSYEGNCDMCFLKGVAKRQRLAEERPDLVGWWAAQEARIGATFRKDGPSYARLAANARDQRRLPMAMDGDPTDTGDCACTD